MRILFAPYNMRVSAARHLAERLDGMRILPEGSRFRARRSDVIVNWGRSNIPDWSNGTLCRVFNDARPVAYAIDKALSWQMFDEKGVPTVERTNDRSLAETWLSQGHVVLVRTTLTGMGGRGIIVCQPDEQLPRTGMYVKYFKRRAEYRVHVFGGKVIDAQQKKKRSGMEASTYVRSYDNGWVFCRGGVTVPDCVNDAAIRAVAALGLDFGGVDVGYNEARNLACVFEVNSAPGIEGTTLDKYEAAIRAAIA